MHRLLLLVSGIGMLGACQRRPTDRHDDAAQMRSALLALTAPGSPTAVARTTLESHGFRCAPVRRASFSGADSLTYALCTESGGGWLVQRRWAVALVDSAGILQDVRVTTGLTGL
jgi:hypothetical protein